MSVSSAGAAARHQPGAPIREAPMTATATTPTTATWNIDATHSLIEFGAKHLMITTVKGRLADARGAIVVEEANPDRSSAKVEFDAKSIDTRSEQRDEHRRSADVLDVAKFPTISFTTRRIVGASAQPGAEFKVVGDLTIHGVTKEIVLDATYEGRGRDPW